MKKASEYRAHAQECRSLAAAMESEDQRAQLLQMAAHWDQLAADRTRLVRNHPELAESGEAAEDGLRKDEDSAGS